MDILQLLWRSGTYGWSIGVYEPDAVGAGIETGLNASQAKDSIPAQVCIYLDHGPWCYVVIFVHFFPAHLFISWLPVINQGRKGRAVSQPDGSPRAGCAAQPAAEAKLGINIHYPVYRRILHSAKLAPVLAGGIAMAAVYAFQRVNYGNIFSLALRIHNAVIDPELGGYAVGCGAMAHHYGRDTIRVHPGMPDRMEKSLFIAFSLEIFGFFLCQYLGILFPGPFLYGGPGNRPEKEAALNISASEISTAGTIH